MPSLSSSFRLNIKRYPIYFLSHVNLNETKRNQNSNGFIISVSSLFGDRSKRVLKFIYYDKIERVLSTVSSHLLTVNTGI